MKLIEALELVAENTSATDQPRFEVGLVCGFTPLHLQTFLTAHLRQRLVDRHVAVRIGLFDDIPGTLRTLVDEPVDTVVVALEWSDIDPRLGIRQLGGWAPRHLPEIVEHAAIWLDQLLPLTRQIATVTPVVISLPTLPLPPMFFTATWQTGVFEAELKATLWKFAAATAAHPRIRILNPQNLDLASPPADRLHVAGSWAYGFPYHQAHAEQLAAALARAVENRQPMKAVITDLDDTLWDGIVGEDGVDNISWDLDHHTQAHGLYQQLLDTLSQEGVLVGVVSKNDPSVVDAALARDDVLISRERIFPLEIGWGSKAGAVARVLARWNVGADQVVFIDDNPTELAEVKSAHPALQCLPFPHGDPRAIYDLLTRLRDLFGRNALSEEDSLRLASLRAAAESPAVADQSEGHSEALLEQAEASLVLDFTKDVNDARAFELICKTNQFNLNGRRPTERSWAEHLRDPHTFLLTATYKDRFGALGKVAVMTGRVGDSHVHVDTWVMSCRAFSRRIEHQCLKALFDRFPARRVSFAFTETPRNAPIARFLRSLHGGPAGAEVSAAAFDAACPRLFHRVVVKDASPVGQ
jgi:FkbH-like protein